MDDVRVMNWWRTFLNELKTLRDHCFRIDISYKKGLERPYKKGINYDGFTCVINRWQPLIDQSINHKLYQINQYLP